MEYVLRLFFNVESTEEADPGFFKDRDGDANPAGYIYVNTPPPKIHDNLVNPPMK